jgi:glycosyltransferase involved in cell wall biosynthesis
MRLVLMRAAQYPEVRVDIMVVDDGSTDNSRAVIMRFHDEVGASGDAGTVVKALAHVKNRGIANGTRRACVRAIRARA